MSLWGKTDTLADTPKFVTRIAYFSATAVDAAADTINLIQSNTGFSTGDAVLYSINGGTVIGGLTNATTYYVRVVGAGLIELYGTYAQAIAAPATTGRLNITAAGVGTHTLRRTGAANPFGDHNYNGQSILFVDREESKVATTRAKGLVSPGWWLYKTYTDNGGNTRHKSELLVAIDVVTATSGDATDDTILPDLTLSISTQPANVTVAAGGDATFTTAVTTNADVVTYQWQSSSDAGVTWVDIAGQFTNTLVLENVVLAANGYRFRVIAKAATLTATSNAATLTVTA